MRIRNLFRFIQLLLLLSISSMGFIYPQEKDLSVDSILSIANKGLQRYLNLIKGENIKNYGFNSEDDYKKITLGYPIRESAFDRSFYDSTILKINDNIRSTNKFHIPIIVEDSIRSFIIVSPVKGSWKTSGFGASKFAQKFNYYIKFFQLESNNHVQLIYEYTSNIYYFLIEDPLTSKQAFYPILPDRPKSINKIELKEYSINDLFSMVHTFK